MSETRDAFQTSAAHAAGTHLTLTPSGVVVFSGPDTALQHAFAADDAQGLIALCASGRRDSEGNESVRFWRDFTREFIRCLCHVPEGTGEAFEIPCPAAAHLAERVLNAPPMDGAEYLSPDVLSGIWQRLVEWTRSEAQTLGGISAFLAHHAPGWSRVGRVTLHLAENKGADDFPFAFMATYAAGLNDSGAIRQLPLGKALRESGGAGDKTVLLRLLEPLSCASKTCPFLAELVESGDIYHPLAWTPQEAHTFLKAIPAYEDAGLLVRLPNWWRKRSRRPQVTATVGSTVKEKVGLDALLDFKLEVVIDGQAIGKQELDKLLAAEDGLVFFRGQWIEVDHEKLQQALDQWKSIEKQGGLSFAEGMRLLAGASDAGLDSEDREDEQAWASARPGEWLEATLRQLTDPPAKGKSPSGLNATLRPYQMKGLEWLWFCAQARLGACLADDMGLGKTIQVLAALQRKKETTPGGPPSLLVVPASLIGNWKREAARFTPGLQLLVIHRSEDNQDAEKPADETISRTDLVITTYGMLTRVEWLSQTAWSWVILDEAQAIKNHSTRQSKAVRRLQAVSRIALSGTPVENHLGDLWSLFDFLNPGLLGSQRDFSEFTKRLRENKKGHYGPLRRLVAPYILRRLKTDKSIITDLPDKTEMKVFCGLSPAQAGLYRQTAARLAEEIENAQGIQRRGLVLAYLMRFKQICNHPDQLSKAGGYAAGESAKFQRLAQICEEIASRGEKVLVFTQFRELAEPLESHIASVFRRSGLILHGGTAVKARQDLVERFSHPDGPPFFVLSLKAGGTGLNLTAASHVIHFDRWWNPAVENQATDRAFRIGQKRNVVVHKFITSGTLEEKIDALLTEKQGTADAILEGGAEKALTEMGNAELLDFVRLDIHLADSSS